MVVTPAMVTDALVLGLFGAAPLVLAAVGFTLIYYLSGFINVAYGQRLGTVADRDRVAPRATGDA